MKAQYLATRKSEVIKHVSAAALAFGVEETCARCKEAVLCVKTSLEAIRRRHGEELEIICDQCFELSEDTYASFTGIVNPELKKQLDKDEAEKN